MQKCEINNSRNGLQILIPAPIYFVFSLFFILPISGQSSLPPPWTAWPIDGEYFVNSNVSLNCGVSTNNTLAIVYWLKIQDSNTAKTLFLGEERISAPPNYVIRRLTDGTGTQLTIYNFGQTDDSVFRCEVTMLELSQKAYISAIGLPSEPSIVSSISEVDLEENTPLQLFCFSSGGNPPNKIIFSWFRNGEPILQNARMDAPQQKFGMFKSILDWKFTRDDFRANFLCEVRHSSVPRSLLSKTKQFEFKYGPIIALNAANPLSVFENSDVYLNCSVDSFPATTSDNIFWTNNFNNYIKGPNLIIKNVKKMDSGNYSCSAIFRRNQTSKLSLNVLYAPLLSASQYMLQVAEESDVNVTFIVDANPQIDPTVSWLNNSDVLANPHYSYEPGRVTLMLLKVSRYTEGNYTLQVSNKMINSSGNVWNAYTMATAHLDVLYKPGEAKVVLMEKVAMVNQNVTLHCVITDLDNRTPTKYYWKSSLGLDLSSSHPYLWLSAISLDSIASYLCLAENLVGRGKMGTYYLDVIVPPTWVSPFLFSNMTARILDPSPSLICVTNSRPFADIIWFHEDQRISNGSRFMITVDNIILNLMTKTVSVLTWRGEFLAEDFGAYSCMTNNISQEMKLFLKFAPIAKNVSPTISADPDSGLVAITSSFCAYPSLTYRWLRNSAQPREDGGKYTIGETSHNDTFRSSKLTILKLAREDEGAYTCEATNEIATTSFTFFVYALPVAPTKLWSDSVTWEKARLAWTNCETCGKPKKFIISYASHNALSNRSLDVGSGSSSYSLTELYPNTSYAVNVCAENRLGRSAPSQPHVFTTSTLDFPQPTDVVYDRSANKLTATLDNRTAVEPVCLRWNVLFDLSDCVAWSGTQTYNVGSDLGKDVSVKSCLVRRPDVCGTQAVMASVVEASIGLPVRDIIIIVCVLGGLFLLLLLGILICCCCCRKRPNELCLPLKRTSSTQTDPTQLDTISLYGANNSSSGLEDLSYNSQIKRKSELSYPSEKIYSAEDYSNYAYSDAGDSGVSQTPKPNRRIVHEIVV